MIKKKNRMETEVFSITAEDVKKVAEDLQRGPERSEEAQEVYDSLFKYFSQMIVRCKDCIHYSKRGRCLCEELPICGDDATTFEPDEDFWCKYGKRRETE